MDLVIDGYFYKKPK